MISEEHQHLGRALSVMDRSECLRMLHTQPVARLAFTRRALPDIVPVNYLMDGEDVLIRLDPGSAVARAVTGTVVALEVDDIDPATRTGWSITIVGEAHEVLDAEQRARALGSRLVPWAQGERTLLLRVSTDRMNGRILL